MVLSFLIFLITGILLLRAGDIHPNPGPHNNNFCRVMYANIRGLKSNIQELTLSSTNFDIIFCSETLVSELRHVSELLIPNFRKPGRNSIPRALGMCLICSLWLQCLSYD